jgi:hypothetical protein
VMGYRVLSMKTTMGNGCVHSQVSRSTITIGKWDLIVA